MKLRAVLRAQRELVLVVGGLACLTIAAAMIAVTAGFAAAGLSLLAIDVVWPDGDGT